MEERRKCVVCETETINFCNHCGLFICEYCNGKEKHNGTFICVKCELICCNTYFMIGGECYQCYLKEMVTTLDESASGLAEAVIKFALGKP